MKESLPILVCSGLIVINSLFAARLIADYVVEKNKAALWFVIPFLIGAVATTFKALHIILLSAK